MLKEVGGDLAFALHGIEREAERQRVVSALQESEKRFRDVLNSVNDGVLVSDLAAKAFVLVNDRMCEMLGASEKEVLELGVMDIHPGKDLPFVIAAFEKQVRGETSLASGIPVERRDGSVFYADVNSKPIVLGGRECLVGCFRDVTEKLALQANLAQSDRLASMGMLAAGVAHEINNPLTFVLYNLEVLSDELPRLFSDLRRQQMAR